MTAFGVLVAPLCNRSLSVGDERENNKWDIMTVAESHITMTHFVLLN